MAQIPNARRVYYKVTGCILESNHKPDIEKAMIEYAKLHVEAALKAASESTLLYDFTEEITNSYPLDNIK